MACVFERSAVGFSFIEAFGSKEPNADEIYLAWNGSHWTSLALSEFVAFRDAQVATPSNPSAEGAMPSSRPPAIPIEPSASQEEERAMPFRYMESYAVSSFCQGTKNDSDFID